MRETSGRVQLGVQGVSFVTRLGFTCLQRISSKQTKTIQVQGLQGFPQMGPNKDFFATSKYISEQPGLMPFVGQLSNPICIEPMWLL